MACHQRHRAERAGGKHGGERELPFTAPQQLRPLQRLVNYIADLEVVR